MPSRDVLPWDHRLSLEAVTCNARSASALLESRLTVLIILTREPSVTTNVDVASEEAASEADDDHTFNHIPPPARPE